MGNVELCNEAIAAIKKAREDGFNVLTADISLSGLSDWHVPVVETVTLEQDPAPSGRDFYKQGDRYAITREGLSKLAVAAGIIWDGNGTRRTDDRTCRDYVSFKAIGGIRKPDGTYAMMKAEYDLDMEVIEEELTAQYAQKAANQRDKTAQQKTEYIDYCVKRDMIQKRKHKLKLAESGAKDRVIRELLGIKATYPLDQIRKPFVILRITVRPDFSDQDVKRAMIAHAIGSMTGIYGAAPQIGYEEAIDVTPQPVQETEQPAPPPEPPEPPAPEVKEGEQAPFDLFVPGPSNLVDFQNSEPERQALTLRKMALKKGYDLAGYLSRSATDKIESLKQETRDKLFDYLNGLPDLAEKGVAA